MTDSAQVRSGKLDSALARSTELGEGTAVRKCGATWRDGGFCKKSKITRTDGKKRKQSFGINTAALKSAR
jgi:hypothetical protein